MKNKRSILKVLEGAEYPASRDSLLTIAEGNEAPSDVLDILEQLPDVDYESPDDVGEASLMIQKGLIGENGIQQTGQDGNGSPGRRGGGKKQNIDLARLERAISKFKKGELVAS